jgi:hypothetical protein
MKIKIRSEARRSKASGQADPTWDALYKQSLPIIVVPD